MAHVTNRVTHGSGVTILLGGAGAAGGGVAQSHDVIGHVTGVRWKEPGPGAAAAASCVFADTWHFGKCTRDFLNAAPYAGVKPLSVDGAATYVLSARAMAALVRIVINPERRAWLEANRFVNVYEVGLYKLNPVYP
jgi:hypothetical protein